MRPISLVKRAHRFISDGLGSGDIAVDATMGNGHDTVFLAQLVGQRGKVYAFDIQRQALDTTRARVSQHGLEDRVKLFLTGHEDLVVHIPSDFHNKINAVMFNLGYLPHSEKKIRTTQATTLHALQESVRVLADLGRITVVAYTGHPGGREESEAVIRWANGLPAVVYNIEVENPTTVNTETPVLMKIIKMENSNKIGSFQDKSNSL